MTINDLIKIYETKKEKYGVQTYRHISNVLKEAKEQHKKDFRGDDHEQSWRAFKGKNLEKLIEYIISDEVRTLALQVVNGNRLERTNGANLSKELSLVKRNLSVDYGEFGSHLPDVDLVIYDPKTSRIVAVLFQVPFAASLVLSVVWLFLFAFVIPFVASPILFASQSLPVFLMLLVLLLQAFIYQIIKARRISNT
ncbi:MAG: hypothetical protein LBL16_01840 [Endomicrobium sp.]|jgi:hypothetical protein|nr:hypothetical protein [Endomicrobium sp.]